jgi:hypothetical protein
MSVTLQISLCYSTYHVLNSHVKSSQVDFLNSSVLLRFTACLLACFCYLLLLLRNSVRGHTSQKTHVTCSLSIQSIGALAGPTENMSRDLYPLLCDSLQKTLLEYCLPCVCCGCCLRMDLYVTICISVYCVFPYNSLNL